MDEDSYEYDDVDRKKLLEAVRYGDIETAKYMVETFKSQDGMHQDLHEECCFLAIDKGYIHILKVVFDKKHLEDYNEDISEYSNSVYMSRVLDTESVEGVDFLLSQGLKLFTLDSYAWSAFIYCLEHDKTNILKHIITLPQMQFPKYQLCFAAMTRNVSILKKSLEYPELLSDINECYDILRNSFPPICCCLYVGHGKEKTDQELDCAKLLIEAGADIKSSPVAITLAAESKNVETILYLLDKGVGLDAYNLTHTLVTLCEIKRGDVALILKCIKRLIEAGADPHAKNDNGYTPLSASIGRNKEVFEYILDLNLDKRYIDIRFGRSESTILSLVYIYYPKDNELIEKILKTGCDVNLNSGYKSDTVLMNACAGLRLDLVKMLLDYGANVNARDGRGKTAGNYCLECGDVDDSLTEEETKYNKITILKLLIDHGLTLDNENTLLISIFDDFDLDCMQILLESDMDKDFIGEFHQNILHLTADTDLPCHVYEMFLKEVKNINQKNTMGRTPLHNASIYLNFDLIQLLLDNKYDVNTMDNVGGSALLEVASRKNVDLTKALLKAGARPEELLKDRMSWLRFDDCLTLLLESGADVLLDIPDDNGNTFIARTLDNFKAWGDEWIINRILKYNPSLTNLFLKFYYSVPIFIDENYFDIVDLLYQSGAPKSELVKNASDDVVELIEQRIGDYSLKSRCRRIIRQNVGLGIKEKVKKLSLPEPLQDFVLLKDIIKTF